MATTSQLGDVRATLAAFKQAGLVVSLDESGAVAVGGATATRAAMEYLTAHDAEVTAVLIHDALSDAERNRLRAVVVWRERAGLSTEAER